MKNEWIGKRKIRIYLLWRKNYHSFCWVQLLKDGSFSLGFQSKTLRFTEYGSAVLHSGVFTKHSPILTRGDVDIKDVSDHHITFHPPRIKQKNEERHGCFSYLPSYLVCAILSIAATILIFFLKLLTDTGRK